MIDLKELKNKHVPVDVNKKASIKLKNGCSSVKSVKNKLIVGLWRLQHVQS